MRTLTLAALLGGLISLAACSAEAPAAGAVEAAVVSPVERGQYLVTAMGCGDCHTPLRIGPDGPEPDPERRLSGHPQGVMVDAVTLPDGLLMAASDTHTAFIGPWGISYAANITGDMHTGIGMYTDEMFIGAMREGRHMGRERPLMPPMPWRAIGSLRDDDLRAILAYLKTVPPVTNTLSGHLH